jgi:hypothetical protein
MPTLDDIPILPRAATPTGDDLIPISDPAGSGTSQVRAIALNQISGLSAADITSAAAGTITISTRVLVISSGTTSTLTLPAASGVLREVIVINGGSGTASVSTVAAGSSSVLTTVSARFLSNGTGWYRV